MNIYCLNPETVPPLIGSVAIWCEDHSIWFNKHGNRWVFDHDYTFPTLEEFLHFYEFQACSQKEALLHLYKGQRA